METADYFVVSGTIIALVLIITNYRMLKNTINEMEEIIDQGRDKQKVNIDKIEILQGDVLRLSLENEYLKSVVDNYVTGNQLLMNNIEAYRNDNVGLRAKLRELEMIVTED